jgi:hypothetical protein
MSLGIPEPGLGQSNGGIILCQIYGTGKVRYGGTILCQIYGTGKVHSESYSL